ncbi:MAG TPA: Lrp/AsnC family transcriptional regulator [Dehalococcoidia bacterium]|mgnify:FL=1|jgi:Lrp/AsnC family transcriptional regulator for asnA, asnC and gidA|nr:AsnC family transcriptional regulator [Dehalococcoidia bacterium]HIA17704.1 Lrp/AsnC family transcriptional regulator [Dehalococcoidia bacterium]HIM91867.1 Lrp/AsnC family transcriptional regulator [Dehalococcoidia bacterium]|tara:strand:+ start:883 stop:1338 length:456 start_codon:yes stop_codon:yes gene_type:complete
MDQLDVRIITHLQKDGTSTNAGIARQVGVSEETVRRRLKRLMSEQFIKVVAVPDASRMGYESQVIIGLQVDADKVDAVGDQLAEMTEVTWVSVTTGSFDIFAWATLKSSEVLSDFLRKRVGVIPGVRKMETFINLASKKEEFGINMESVTL